MRFFPLAGLATIAVLVLLKSGVAAEAAEITIRSTPTLKTTLEELVPAFERATGHKLVTAFASAATLKQRIQEGERVDVAILLPPLIDELINQGKLIAGTRVDVSRSAVGVAIRAGATKPDVSSVAAVKQTLTDANAISYAKDSASSQYLIGLIDRLGIAAEVKPKLKAVPGGEVVEAVADGAAEVTVITIPNIIGVRGVELAGQLPAELQNYTVFSAGIGADARDRAAANAFIEFLMSPTATQVLAAKGMERIPSSPNSPGPRR
ncbi:MAG: ABC transporter substrate-binding protein [Bradyrhizobium sp.]|nr:ABC transporter substrate-binding protein [Bradyrhizobium sp.]